MTYTSLKTALLDYVQDGWGQADQHAKEVARALFTSYCIMEDIYVDTIECDRLMHELYLKVPGRTNYDDFYGYMVELIV